MRLVPDICYIFHVIGTVSMQHVEWALASLREQDPFHWKRFVLFNASDMPSQPILDLVDRSRFEIVEEFVPAYNGLASCTADWLVQMRKIDGARRYLCHKADFFLPPWICREFQDLKAKKPFIVVFHKFDMKERATLDDIREYANMPFEMGLADPRTGEYGPKHIGKLAIGFQQTEGGMDGTMHGYSDAIRGTFQPSIQEIHRRWGVADWFRSLDLVSPGTAIRDPRFFAVHMWHYAPDRMDTLKNITGERF